MRIPTPKVVGMNWSIGIMPRSLGRCPHHIGVYEIHMLGGVQVVEPLKTSTTSINKANGIFNLSPSNAFMVEEKYQPLPEINIDLFTDLVEVLTLAVLNPADVGTQKLEVLIDGYPKILGCDAAGEIVEVHLTLAELYTPSDLVICATGPLNRKDNK
ncbi:hypothetical protein APSETT444_006482 [Aspergillus pseudonomiae]